MATNKPLWKTFEQWWGLSKYSTPREDSARERLRLRRNRDAALQAWYMGRREAMKEFDSKQPKHAPIPREDYERQVLLFDKRVAELEAQLGGQEIRYLKLRTMYKEAVTRLRHIAHSVNTFSFPEKD